MMILYLCNGNNDMIRPKIVGQEAAIDTKWRHEDRVRRKIEKLLFEKFDVKAHCIFGHWEKRIHEYDTIVIEALKANSKLIEYVKNRAKKGTRIILWHWNKMYPSEIYPDDPICEGCELWSFDPDDCKEYGMRYNTQYYDKENCKFAPKVKIKYDVWFVGADKGRLNKLLQLQEEMCAHGVKCKFHITRSSESKPGYQYQKSISYAQNLSFLAESKAVLDFPKEGQKGLTMRPLEALFHHKKVITTSKIIKEHGFYTPNNIFIIGYDSWERIHDFLNSPFDESIKSDLEYYEVKNWIKRFAL